MMGTYVLVKMNKCVQKHNKMIVEKNRVDEPLNKINYVLLV